MTRSAQGSDHSLPGTGHGSWGECHTRTTCRLPADEQRSSEAPGLKVALPVPGRAPEEGPWPARAGSSVQDAELGPARLRQPSTPRVMGVLRMRRKDAGEETGRLCPGDCCDAEPGCWDGGVWAWQGLCPGGNHECWALLSGP